MKVGDLVRYRRHHSHGFFVVVTIPSPSNMWITMLSLSDGKEYVDLKTSMEIISQKT